MRLISRIIKLRLRVIFRNVFNDGNDHTRRLLTHLLIYQHDYIVSKYYHPRKLIAENQLTYYENLLARVG